MDITYGSAPPNYFPAVKTYIKPGSGSMELSANKVVSGVPTGTFVGRLMGTSSDMVLSIVSGPFAITQDGEITLTGATGAAGSILTARIKAEREEPFLSIVQDFDIDVVAAQVVLVAVTMATISEDVNLLEGTTLWDLGTMVSGENRTISPNDGRWVFNSDKSKVVRGVNAWSAGTTAVSVTQTHAGASNSPLTTTANIVITAAPIGPAYDELVSNDEQLTDALANHGFVGGKVIALNPYGVYDHNRVISVNPMTRLTITSSRYDTRANLPSVIFGNSSKLSFIGIDHGEDLTTGYCVSLQTGASATDIWWDNCEFRGAEFDTDGDWHLDSPTYRSGMDTAGGYFYAFRVTNSDLHHLRSCLKPSVWRGPCQVIGNHFDAFYEDGVSIAWDYLNPANGTIVDFNYFTRSVGLVSDRFGNTDFVNKPDPQILGPHVDAVQLFEYNTIALGGDGIRDVQIVGNVVYDGQSRGVLQFNLMRSEGTWASRCKVAHNTHIVDKLDAHCPYMSDCWGMYAFNNRIIYRDPGNAGNQSNVASIYNIEGKPKSFLGAQMTSIIATSGAVERGVGLAQNVTLLNTLASHVANLDGPFPIPRNATKSQVLAAVKHKAGSPLAHLRDVVDYDARTINFALEPSWLGFDSFNGTLPGPAKSETPFRKLQGGGPGQVIVATNCRYQIADDELGTNATAYTSATGTVDEGKYIRADATNPSASLTLSCTLTINGWANQFNVIAASTASFSTVDNQGAAYSTTPALPSAASQKKLIIATEFMMDAVSSGAQTLFGRIDQGGALGLSSRTGASWRLALANSGVILVSSSHAPEVGVWHRMLISIDLADTSGDAANVLKWYDNGTRVTYGGTPAIVTTGTANFNQSDLGALGILSRAAGLELSDAKFRYLWMDWGPAGYSLPDLTDPAVRDKFTADTIGTDGSGPTGAVPKVFYHGSAAELNAGLANKGSLVLPLTKQVGTYNDVDVPEISELSLDLPTTGETHLDTAAFGSAIPEGGIVTLTLPELPSGITFSVE